MKVRFCKKGPDFSKFSITFAFKFEQTFFLEILKLYLVTLNSITYQLAINLHGERYFVPSTTQIWWSHIGPEKRECECKVLLFLLAFLEWHNWHQVWVHVTFKNRTCENYMSWEFTFIACMYGSSSSRPAMLPAFSATTQFSTAKGQS